MADVVTPAAFGVRGPRGIESFEAGDTVPADVAVLVPWLGSAPATKAPAPAAAPAEADPDWGSMRKADLVAAAEARGIATTGTKADLIAELENHAAE